MKKDIQVFWQAIFFIALSLASTCSRAGLSFNDTAFVPPWSTTDTVFRTTNHGYWVITGFPSGYLPPSGKFENVQVFDEAGVTRFNFPSTGVTITAIPLPDPSPALLSGVLPQVMGTDTLFALSDGSTWRVIDFFGGGGSTRSTASEPVLLYRDQGVQLLALLAHGGTYEVSRYSGALVRDTAFVPPWSTTDTVFRTTNHGYWVITGFPSGYLPPSGKFENVQVFDEAGVTRFNFPSTGVTITAIPLPDPSPALLSGVLPQVMGTDTLFTLSDGSTWKVIDFFGGGGSTRSTASEPVLLYRDQGVQLLALLAHGGTYEVSLFSPPPPCTQSLSIYSVNATAAGGGFSAFIASSRSTCTWTAIANASWITITNGASVFGSGPVSFSVAVNSSTVSREGTLTIGGQTLTVTQQGASPPSHTLAISKAGTGTVTSTPGGIACGTSCVTTFVGGGTVILNATADSGGTFAGWGGDCAGFGTQPTCTLSMNAAKNVTATFNNPGSTYSRDYVQKAYVAYYGRPADPGGQNYWAVRMDAEGQSLNAIIGAFGYSEEFNRRYGGLSYDALVTKIYQQSLGRAPDPGGLNWYVDELQAGRRTLQTITLDVLNGATTPPDSTVVANRLDVAAYYTAKVAAGCPYGSEQDGVNTLAGVTALAGTVSAAKASIDSRCGP